MAGEAKRSTSGKEPISYKKPRGANGRTKKVIGKRVTAKKNPAEKKERKPTKSRARKSEADEGDFQDDHGALGLKGLRSNGEITIRTSARISTNRISYAFAVQPPDNTLPDNLDGENQLYDGALPNNLDDGYNAPSVYDNPSSVFQQSISDEHIQDTSETEIEPSPEVEPVAPGKLRVIILHADGRQSFVLNKSDLIEQSGVIAEYVKAEETANMTETTEISLEEISGDAFTVFQVWLETGQIKIPSKFKHVRFSGNFLGDSISETTFVTDVDPILDLLADCWLLGSSMQSLPFINNVMCKLRDTYKGACEYNLPLALGNINKICANTVKGSQLRKFIIDVLHFYLDGPGLTAAAEQGLIPLEIMSGIAADAVDNEVKGVLRKAPWEINPKVYFVWEGGQVPPSPVLDF